MSGISIDLTGKVVLITGGTRGIGKSIADKFKEAGATIILTGTRQSEIDALSASTGSETLRYLPLDFSSATSITNFVELIRKEPVIDVLINNAGINRIAPNTETTNEDFDALTDVNLKGPYILAREVSKIMKKQCCGRIINISSIWSSVTRSGRSVYTTTKWGIVGLTKALSVELAPYNILVNAVGPGFTMTELTAGTNTKEDIEKITKMIPMQRMADPSEIANFVLFLSSDLNSYLTGQNIVIDGGYTSI